ncbi:MAG: hypothetical protein WAM82_28830 [Thermoanaerobaculia bacterium]
MLAISSSIGAMFSLTSAFTALVSAGYVFGYQLAFSLSAGATCGLLVLLRLSRRSLVTDFLTSTQANGWSAGASYLTLLSAYFSRTAYLLYYAFAMVVYLGLTITEFAVFRVTLEALAPSLATPEIVLIISMTLLICFSYVFIGGYRGGLITDYFQLAIIFLFLGSLMREFKISSFILHLPSPMGGKVLTGSIPELILLHFGSFVGGFAAALFSIDQWYRTLGTLPLSRARKVLITGIILICLGSLVPILIGSYALNLSNMPVRLANTISTHLLINLLNTKNQTVRFLFFMTLAAVVLTTLDTYLITLQQLYYEFSIRFRASSSRTYILEYLTKWRNVRLVGFIMGVISFLASFFVANDSIYLFGVGALAAVIFLSPVLIIPLFSPTKPLPEWYPWASLIASVAIYWPLVYFFARLTGPVSIHLYIIAAAAGVASFFVNGTFLAIWRIKHAKYRP